MTKCLLTKNLDGNQDETIDMVKELLAKEEITDIEKIIPYDMLKKEYKGIVCSDILYPFSYDLSNAKN